MPKKPHPPLDDSLLKILVCPVTRGPLIYDAKNQELRSPKANVAFPIRQGIPVLLEEEARPLKKPSPATKP